MYAVVGRDGQVVRPRVYHVKGCFCLGQEMVPLVDGEVRMGAHKDREEVVPERLDCALSFVGALLVGRYTLYSNMLLFEETKQGFREFVVEDLELYLMAMVLEESIRARECCS